MSFFALPTVPVVGRAMDTDFLEQIQNLKLTMEEGEEITIQPMQREKILEEWALSLIGKFLSSRSLN